MQAQDLLNVLLFIRKNSPFDTYTGGGIKSIMLGNSYGGYLANLVAKISPWNVNAIIDNSSFVNFSNYIWRLIGFGKELDFTKFHSIMIKLYLKILLFI